MSKNILLEYIVENTVGYFTTSRLLFTKIKIFTGYRKLKRGYTNHSIYITYIIYIIKTHLKINKFTRINLSGKKSEPKCHHWVD